MDAQLRAAFQRAQREIGARAWQVNRQPWRWLRNRRLRGEIAAIMAVLYPDWKPDRR